MVCSSTSNSEGRSRMIAVVFMMILPTAWACIPTHSGSTPGIPPCPKCIPNAMYDESITCPNTGAGNTCSIIPASEALYYNASDTCMEAYFRCPPDSKFQLNLEPPRDVTEFDSILWQEMGFRMICRGSPVGRWVLTAAPRTEPNPPTAVIKSITCYVQVPQVCVLCDPALITVSGSFTKDETSIVNGCQTRTLTCPTAIEYGPGMIIPGPATMVATCNAANSAWMYMGNEVTQASCRPCVSCDPSLVNVFPGFTSDSGPVIVNGCLTRTLTCAAMINYNDGVIAGPATLVLKCNAANTEWTYMGTKVTQATCSKCQSCPMNLISVSPGPPGFTSDSTIELNGCSQRTLTCMSADMETYIQYNSGAGMISDGGTTTMTVSCNAAGTAWLYAGPPITPITQAECKFKCGSCDPNLVTISSGFTSDSGPIIADGCLTRTLTCPAAINYGSGTIPGPATLILKCNAANTEWTYMGTPVAAATCNQCKSCPMDLISIPQPGFTSDQLSELNGCSQRTLTCTNANSETYIQYNSGAGMVSGGGTTTMMTVTCNDAGTAWIYAGPPITPITQAECKLKSCVGCADILPGILPQDCPPGYFCLPFLEPPTSVVVGGCSQVFLVCGGAPTRFAFTLTDGTVGILTVAELIADAPGKRVACLNGTWIYTDVSNNILNYPIKNVICLA